MNTVILTSYWAYIDQIFVEQYDDTRVFPEQFISAVRVGGTGALQAPEDQQLISVSQFPQIANWRCLCMKWEAA